MPLLDTTGNNTADAYQGGSAVVPNYIENVFSTWLYNGTSATQTITNGIDLSTKGGLVWVKNRTTGASYHGLFNTASNYLSSNNSGGITNDTTSVNAFSSTGFQLGNDSTASPYFNTTSNNYVSWTFKKQPKFYDYVTYTGNGSSTNNVSHNLGSVPGFIVLKRTDSTSNWAVAASDGAGNYLQLTLNLTDASTTSTTTSNIANSTTLNVGYMGVHFYGSINVSGATYVAYLFASNAGGFGVSNTDNVITCGSYTGTGSNPGPTINLGYEPQFIIVKNITEAFDWLMYDNMRGMPVSNVNTSNTKFLRPNTSGAEAGGATISPTATGFQINTTYAGTNTTGDTYIYIAIRRGPMKVPTVGTSVFSPVARTGTSANATVTAGFAPDLVFPKERTTGVGTWFDKLRGITQYFYPSSAATENSTAAYGDVITAFTNTGMTVGADATFTYVNNSGEPMINYFFQRAPSFFDEVCYTGNGSTQNINHNLGVIPELVIFKNRSVVANWRVCFDFTSTDNNNAVLNTTANANRYNYGLLIFNSKPTSTVLPLYSYSDTNGSGNSIVAYLFATCAGVSKVGTYIGNGTTQAIACGFSGGARFVLIKQTDGGSDWYVYDTARGMTTLTDPYLLINSTAAEVATLGAVTSTTGGFSLNSAISNTTNYSGSSYLFLAIA